MHDLAVCELRYRTSLIPTVGVVNDARMCHVISPTVTELHWGSRQSVQSLSKHAITVPYAIAPCKHTHALPALGIVLHPPKSQPTRRLSISSPLLQTPASTFQNSSLNVLASLKHSATCSPTHTIHLHTQASASLIAPEPHRTPASSPPVPMTSCSVAGSSPPAPCPAPPPAPPAPSRCAANAALAASCSCSRARPPTLSARSYGRVTASRLKADGWSVG
jgi:hypothetical protein